MNPNHAKAIRAADKILPYLIYVFYPCILIYVFISNPISDWKYSAAFVLVPGISFILVSIFRYIYNAPRPYELNPDLKPVIKKTARGNPSQAVIYFLFS